MTEDGPVLTVDEFVDYCRTQAGLLSGSIETMGTEADELLDDIDAEMADIREQLDDGEGVGRADERTEIDGRAGRTGGERRRRRGPGRA